MDIKSIDLPEKVKRNTKARRVRANKRILGRNIDERSPRIDNRKDFGHWECDLVLGTRPRMIMCCLLCVNGRHVASSWSRLKIRLQLASWRHLTSFASSMDPNGIKSLSLSQPTTAPSSQIYQILSKFPRRLCTMLTLIYPCDKCSVEDIAKLEVWCNPLSRRILNYKTSKECFDVELDHIYRRR